MLHIPDNKLKERLVKDGVVTAKVFDAALEDAKRMGQRPADILISKNLITIEYYTGLVAGFYEVESANLSVRQVDEKVARILPENIAREKRVVVFNKRKDGSFDVAMEDPSNLQTVEYLTKYLKAKVNSYLASREDLNRGFSFYSRQSTKDFKKVIEENIAVSLRSRVSGAKEAAKELPIVAIVDNILAYAISSRASDIHIEILTDGILIRYRIDGILHEIIRVPKEVHPAIVARIKLLAGLKLDEHNKPQDGRFRHKVGKDIMDIRVAIMPTFYGEKVEMRLLSATERPQSLEELGLLKDHVALIRKNIKKTFGMILVTGPTGSGKTTTLYSVMSILNRPEVNIVTIEDPIEYDMKYINQTQINPAAGITFASGLREIVRQDPNIIMVGEIRDQETAQIAVQAALTGHLVLSSLHTNDAPTAVPRLLDLGLPPFLVAAVMNMMAAQRLVRRICSDCIVSYKPDAVILEALKKQLADLGLDAHIALPATLYKGTGCPACGKTGYRGRVGIFEILSVSEKIRKLIVNPKFTLGALRVAAKEEGMASMFEDGLRKVERGMTTVEEVLRVIRE
ncbi:MAG: GspE/PulE family protein [Patescibacteria group bacterium]